MSDCELVRVKVTIELTDEEGLVHTSSRTGMEMESHRNDYDFIGATFAWALQGLGDRYHSDGMIEAMGGAIEIVGHEYDERDDAKEVNDAISDFQCAIYEYRQRKLRELRERLKADEEYMQSVRKEGT